MLSSLKLVSNMENKIKKFHDIILNFIDFMRFFPISAISVDMPTCKADFGQ